MLYPGVQENEVRANHKTPSWICTEHKLKLGRWTSASEELVTTIGGEVSLRRLPPLARIQALGAPALKD